MSTAATPPPDDVARGGGELRSQIRREIRAAERAGAREQTVEPLTASQIDAPLMLPPESPVESPAPLRIRGYVVETEISRGGQASVFSGVHETTGRKVAIKVLAGGPFSSSRSRARFDREVEALAKLDHPGIVGILDRGRTDDGTPFLVMDYVQGEDLDAYLRRRPGCTMKQVVRLFASIAETVHEAHIQGIIHRDLKPGNIRIDPRGQAHVLDFGLAQLLDDDHGGGALQPALTTTGHLVGSLPWTSPEQVSRSPIGPRSDVYALGVMLYQGLTGQYPYTVVGGLHEIIRNIRHIPPAPPEKIKDPPFGRIDGTLAQVILKALAKRPQDRYASAAALAADLSAYCLDRRTSVASDADASRRTVLYAAVAACLLLAGAGALSVFRTLTAPFTVTELPTFINDVGMRFVQVPSGRMSMGSPHHEEGRSENEDRHSVQLTRGFFILTTEVTRAQYERVMGGLPSGCAPVSAPDAPVDHVTWSEAVEFCRRLGELDGAGKEYALPTDAQWEYACRAGTAGAFAGSGDIDSMAWYLRSGTGGPRPVASKRPNHWGLYDAHGNVAEWCRDSYRDHLGLVERVDPQISAQEISRVVRGGSAYDDWPGCRSAFRQSLPIDARKAGVGFRVVVAEHASAAASDPR